MNLKELEKKIGYDFKNKNLLELALVHSSYNNNSHLENNERLEFLGDAVLELTVSEFLFNNYKDMSEGNLSRVRAKIVCEESLAAIAKKILLGEFLKLGHGEKINNGQYKNSILSDAMEAVFAAIFLDGDFENAKQIILNLIEQNLDLKNINPENLIDPKSHLQELLQENSTEPISYKIINESGPDHNKIYTAQVWHENKCLGQGVGKSKKDAEQEAALQAINKFFS